MKRGRIYVRIAENDEGIRPPPLFYFSTIRAPVLGAP